MHWGYFCALLLSSSLIAGIALQPKTAAQWRAWGIGSVVTSYLVATNTPPSAMSFLTFTAPLFTVALYQLVTFQELKDIRNQ